MDFFIQNWFLLVMAAGSGLLLLWPLLSGQGAGVGAAEAVRLMNREKAVVIDVSEAEEFAKGHIAGSRNIPLAQLGAEAKGLPGNKTLPLVVVCPTGARASRALPQLKKLGHENSVVMQGGLAAWREAKLPTAKA